MVLNILNRHIKIWIQLAVMVRDRSLTDLILARLSWVKSQCPSY